MGKLKWVINLDKSSLFTVRSPIFYKNHKVSFCRPHIDI